MIRMDGDRSTFSSPLQVDLSPTSPLWWTSQGPGNGGRQRAIRLTPRQPAIMDASIIDEHGSARPKASFTEQIG